MKLADFTPLNGETDNSKIWKTGAQSNLIAQMSYGGKPYQVKIHAAKPKWYNTDYKISKLEQQISACDPADLVKLEQLNNELDSLRRAKPKYDKKDSVSDAFLDYKQRLIRTVSSIGDANIVPPADYWKEPIEFKGSETFSIDATPWVITDVGHSDKPLLFKDLSERQQYDVIASLAEELDKLHRKGILHCDLKVGNTLIVRQGSGFKGVLIDFDCALILNDLYNQTLPYDAWLNIIGGTFFAPEMQEMFSIASEGEPEDFEAFDFRRITDKVDIFALGVTIYEYYYGEASGSNILPMLSEAGERLDQAAYGAAVAAGYKTDFPDSMPDLLYAAINWMMEADPAQRPTAMQVCEIFRNADASSIPAKYQRNPLWEEHREAYELTLPEGYLIRHARKPYYQFSKNGGSTWFTRSIKELETEHIVKRTDGAGGSGGEGPVVISTYWESDATGEMPKCVRRASTEGKYYVKVDGLEKLATYSDLCTMGVVCTEAECATLWPRDSHLHLTTSNKIIRDLTRGVGYYRYGMFMTVVASKELVGRGIATDNAVKTPLSIRFWARDEEQYEVNPDADTSAISSVTRHVFSGTNYTFNFTDGHSETFTTEQMLNKGYIRRK